MRHEEEQQNELEAIQSIYYDEFKQISQQGDHPIVFSIIVTPEGSESSTSADNMFDLKITFTPTYPEECPLLDMENAQGLEEEEAKCILDYCKTVCQENKGMAMVFTLVSSAKEFLEKWINERQLRIQKQEDERVRKEEEEEMKKYQGTKVTPETFMAWMGRFKKEMEELAKKEALVASGGRPIDNKESRKGKLTGRQLFETDVSLAKSDAAFMEEGDIAVDIDLFDQELEGLDLDDEDEESNAVWAGFTEDDD